MRIIRFDSVGGASGDMILGALVGLGASSECLEKEIQKLIPNENFRFQIGIKSSFGASGVYLTVAIDEHSHHHSGELEHCKHSHTFTNEYESSEAHAHHEHDSSFHSHEEHHTFSSHLQHNHFHGRTYADIRSLIQESSLETHAKHDALAAFAALAKVESEAHQTPLEKVHFHEIGATDSVIDTVGCSLALQMLGVDGISLSPLPIGEGTFTCAHGTYPLPAPAVSFLIRDYGLPVSFDVEQCEMLTPTAASLFAIWNKLEIPNGARLIATVNSFGTREMKTRPNLLRASLYEIDEIQTEMLNSSENDEQRIVQLYNDETLVELTANIDDCSGETLASTATVLFKSGALDVWFEPIFMKKGRPAQRICVLAEVIKRAELLDILFRYANTLGVRESLKRRFSLMRRWEEAKLSYGIVRIKIGVTKTGEVLTFAPEYEDCQRIAEEFNLPYEKIYREAMVAYLSQKP